MGRPPALKKRAAHSQRAARKFALVDKRLASNLTHLPLGDNIYQFAATILVKIRSEIG
jgi:hypothetical protein